MRERESETGREGEKCSNWKIARQLKILRSVAIANVGPNVSQVRHEVRARKFLMAWQHPLPLANPHPYATVSCCCCCCVCPLSTCCGAAA